MEWVKDKKVIIFALILVAALVIGWIVSSNLSQNSQVKIVFEGSAPEMRTRDLKDIKEYLTETELIDNTKVSFLNIVVTTNQDPNPVFIREDIPGQLLLTSGYNIENDVATITLFVSQTVLDMPESQRADLLNYYFWESANLILGMSGKNATYQQPIFVSS